MNKKLLYAIIILSMISLSAFPATPKTLKLKILLKPIKLPYKISSTSFDGKNVFLFSQNVYSVYKFSLIKESPKILFKDQILIDYLKIKTNHFTRNFFAIRNDGYMLKEYNKNGKLINTYRFPVNKGINFDFLSADIILLTNLPEPPYNVSIRKKYKNFSLYDLKKKLFIVSFGSTSRPYIYNDKQDFIVKDNFLYTVDLENMKILVYDLNTYSLVKRTSILNNFKKPKIKREKVSEGIWVNNCFLYYRVKFFQTGEKIYFILIKSKDGKDGIKELTLYSIDWQKNICFKGKLNTLLGEPSAIFGRKILFYRNKPFSAFWIAEFYGRL